MSANQHQVQHAARSLVCDRCWHDFFDTTDFQLVCLGYGPSIHIYSRARQIASMRQINESVAKGCNWCRFIQTFIKRAQKSKENDGLLEVSLTPRRSASTPKGNNTFYLNIKAEQHRLEWFDSFLITIHAFTDEMDMAAAFVTARKVQTDINSDHAHQQIKCWLEECGSHECCVQQPGSTLPKRVVEVAPEKCPDTPRLLITEGQKGRYATLSYCWGVEPYGLLSMSNICTYTQGLDVEALPQTFQDAIAVAKTLRIPYLWIDALCIIQDSREDKMQEISVMERIYRESFLTVVAASSANTTDGFLQPRPPPWKSYTIPFRLAGDRFGSMSIQEFEFVEYDERSEPINKRAWTLQEQIIPNRCLIYASHTLQWRCDAGVKNLGNSLHYTSSFEHGKYCETISFLRRPAAKREDQFTRWLRIVHIYAARRASLVTDKLTALAGITKEFSDTLGPRYYAGLWEYSLLPQLTWRTLPRSYHSKLSCTRPITYRAPSWSWASIEGRVWFPYDIFREDASDKLYRCSLIHCETMVKSATSPFGEVVAASLKIKAVLRQAWLIPSREAVLWLAEDNPSLAAAETLHLANFRQDNPEHAHDLQYASEGVSGMEGKYDVSGDWPPALVFCLPVLTWGSKIHGLLLAPADRGTFRRVGSFDWGEAAGFDHLQRVEIMIV
ncbi:hypothetical protein EPUS_06697 [Endocarpon pusillum Z07020]|uniref:Heterokaryon incompatibility domain-containing protein n=1 Tax=Endocarpon pusillum (strain Z07020 / HMAS-L-300199) TaxID=1263415 RepID=U1HFW1_ENDPU|nr:uncharacterized protein EPUS_06697 [Endocarpon pusillum Z07020]ERF69010.1 hypothetical protein EPUS_06697 [Endocarpon pusillum Z07020]